MILVAENLTVASSTIQRAVRERNPAPLRRVAANATAVGAAYLDVNLGAGREGRGEAVGFVLEVLANCWHGGLLADTPDPAVMEEVARTWVGEVVLNGYSGDPGREGVLEVAARHGLEVVVLMMAGGIPRRVEERLALAAELAGRCAQVGIGPERLWFDPVVAPLGWIDGQEYDVALIETLRQLPGMFGMPVRTLLGVSNLTTGAAPGNRALWMQQVFLPLAAGAGLTHVMMDITDTEILRVVRALEVFAGDRLYAPEEFV